MHSHHCLNVHLTCHQAMPQDITHRLLREIETENCGERKGVANSLLLCWGLSTPKRFYRLPMPRHPSCKNKAVIHHPDENLCLPCTQIFWETCCSVSSVLMGLVNSFHCSHYYFGSGCRCHGLWTFAYFPPIFHSAIKEPNTTLHCLQTNKFSPLTTR